MKLKDKTGLRNLYHSTKDNTGSLDSIEIYSDGSWEVMSCSTRSDDYVIRQSIRSFFTIDPYSGVSESKQITELFKDIEDNYFKFWELCL